MSTSPSWFDKDKFSKLAQKVGKVAPHAASPARLNPAGSVSLKPRTMVPVVIQDKPKPEVRVDAPETLSPEMKKELFPELQGEPGVELRVEPPPQAKAESRMILPMAPVIMETRGRSVEQDAEMQTLRQELEKNKEAAAERLEGLQRELETYQKEILNLSRLSSHKDDRCRELEDKGRALEDKCREMEERYQNAEKQLEESFNFQADWQQERQTLMEKVAELENGGNQARDLEDKFNREQEAVRLELKRQTELVEEKEKGMVMLSEAVQSMRQELTDLYVIKEAMFPLQQELEATKQNVGTLQQEAEATRAELEATQVELSKAEQTYQSYEAEIKEVQSNYLLTQQTLQETRAALQDAAQNSAAKVALDNMRSEYNNLLQQNMLIQAQFDQQAKEIRDLKAKAAGR